MRELKKVIGFSQKSFNLEEVQRTIPSDYLVVFFAPVEWMEEVGQAISTVYKSSIGSSSYKDINKNEAEYNCVTFLGIKYDDVRFALLKDVEKKVITYYKEVSSLGKIYKKNHSILLEFTDGLSRAEESVLTVLTNELRNIPVVGGSSADNGSFTKTLVCVNGECASNATALCMLTTPMVIETYCENIYKPRESKAIITSCDLFKRKIHEINNMPAVDFYCKELNTDINNINSKFISHPIARRIGERYFVTSIMNVEGKTFNTYARSFNHSYISICDPINYLKLWDDRSKEIKDKYLGGIFINCIFRTNLFEEENTMKDFIKYLSAYGEFACMTSYGEQYCDSHANQTMSVCLFREC